MTRREIVTCLEECGQPCPGVFEDQPGRILEFEENFYTRENVSYMEEIVLDYKYRFFSVEFAALNNLQTGDLRYRYMMENLDLDWNRAGIRNYVSYTNMKSESKCRS